MSNPSPRRGILILFPTFTPATPFLVRNVRPFNKHLTSVSDTIKMLVARQPSVACSESDSSGSLVCCSKWEMTTLFNLMDTIVVFSFLSVGLPGSLFLRVVEIIGTVGQWQHILVVLQYFATALFGENKEEPAKRLSLVTCVSFLLDIFPLVQTTLDNNASSPFSAAFISFWFGGCLSVERPALS